MSGKRPGGVGEPDRVRPEAPAAKIARLEARVAELEATETKLTTEREMLRPAASYFAGETNR